MMKGHTAVLMKEMRAKFVNDAAWKTICKEVDKEWFGIPYEVRDGALRDAWKAKKATEAQLDAEAGKHGRLESTKKWRFKFRKKKDATESIQLRCQDLNGTHGWFGRLFGCPNDRSVMCTMHDLPQWFETDVRLFHDKRLGRYYLIIAVPPVGVKGGDSQAPQQLTVPDADLMRGSKENCESEGRIAVGDPGSRTFMTMFNPKGVVHKWGEHTSDVL